MTIRERLAYSIRREFVDEFHERHVATLRPRNRVLDIGGHRTAKRGSFNIDNFNMDVVYLNISVQTDPHVVGDAMRLPFRNEAFDVVIASELLEHVFDARMVVDEVYRVMKKGGTLLICVPFLHRIHGDPGDFGRYTDQYWQLVLNQAGFSDIVAEKQGAYWSVLAEMVRGWFNQPRGGRLSLGALRRLLGQVTVPLLRSFARRWDARPSGSENSFLMSFTTGFGIRAQKK